MALNSSTVSTEDQYATQGPKLDIITIICFSLAVVAVCLRFLSRALIKASFWWDDFVILLALVCRTHALETRETDSCPLDSCLRAVFFDAL